MAEQDKKRKKSSVAKKTKPKTAREVETLIDKTRTKNKQRKTKIRVYYSLLTIVLLVCLAKMSCDAILNISKTISYKTKINTMKRTKDQAEKRNENLKEEIKNFSSASSFESIARNNLKMAGENEVLVIINSTEDSNAEKDKKGHQKKIGK